MSPAHRRGRRTICKHWRSRRSFHANVTLHRRCGLRQQPAMLIERSPPSPHVAFLTEAYALMDYSPRTACVASRRRQIAGSAMVPAAELRGQHNGAFAASLGVRDVPSRDALYSMQRIRAGIERRRSQVPPTPCVPCVLVLKVGSPRDLPLARMGANGPCSGSRTKSRLFIRRPASPTSGIARSTCHTRKYTPARIQAANTGF